MQAGPLPTITNERTTCGRGSVLSGGSAMSPNRPETKTTMFRPVRQVAARVYSSSPPGGGTGVSLLSLTASCCVLVRN